MSTTPTPNRRELRQQAMQKLPALKASTNMLICGEDLGMVHLATGAAMIDVVCWVNLAR